MANVLSKIEEQFPQQTFPKPDQDAGNVLRNLIDANAYVGEVVSLGYNEAILQIHDYHRQQVGGIPALCFLVASRVNPQNIPDPKAEDTSVILLRVMDQADLPNAEEARRVRVETAQRVSGEVGTNWDDRAVMDATTHNLLSYAGVRRRVIGTFYMADLGTGSTPNWQLCFGSDISNYYPNRGLKVFKPRGDILKQIVNFRDPMIFALMLKVNTLALIFYSSCPSLNSMEKSCKHALISRHPRCECWLSDYRSFKEPQYLYQQHMIGGAVWEKQTSCH